MPTKIHKIRTKNKSQRKSNRKTKSLNQSTTTSVTKIQRSHSLSNSSVPKHYITDEINEKQKIRHNIHLNLHCSSSMRKSTLKLNNNVQLSDKKILNDMEDQINNNCTKSTSIPDHFIDQTNQIIFPSLDLMNKVGIKQFLIMYTYIAEMKENDFKCSKDVDLITYRQERIRKRRIGGFYGYSPCCCFMTGLCVLFLLTGLVALLVATLGIKKSTEMSTTMTTVTTITTTSSTSVTSTTITSTTTTALNCGESCLNRSWIDPTNEIARWPFDATFNDIVNGYNPISSMNLPTLVTGYLGQAALFNASMKQTIFTPFIPLYNRSFTIEAWIKPTGFPNTKDHSIVGLCPIYSSYICLHLMIRYQQLYFGFHNYDRAGTTNLTINNWYHIAFVYDYLTKQQTVYLNGFQDGFRNGFDGFLAFTGNFSIGTNVYVSTGTNYYQGYMDELSINYRVKSACEILERATLAARFKFDSSSPYIDSGPNSVSTIQSTTSIVTGYINQAISFTGSPTSYFQISGFTSLGVTNQPFSIALWIKPSTLSGTLVHLSTSSTGTGSTCFPLLGFALNGAIIAQILTSTGTIVSASGPILPTSSSWIPIVQTWSATNGLKLYVNSTLISSVAVSTFLGSETTPNYLTLGNCLSGCVSCSGGSIGNAGPYTGAIDDWRIFSRELSFVDVCTLFNYLS